MSVATIPRRRMLAVRGYLSELWSRREFALFLALGNLRARNASTSLGLFWWVLNPTLLAGVYLLVFGLILQGARRDPQYLAYLLSGIYPFYYTRAALTGGASSVIAGSKLLVNIRFPRLVLPISSLIESAVGFAASLAVFFLIAGPFNGVVPGATVLWLLPVFLLQTAFNLGISAGTARLTVPFRDVANLLPYLTRLWLYLSPIIWPLAFLERIPSWSQAVLRANPLFPFLSLYRTALLGGPLDPAMLLQAAAWGLAVLAIGVTLFVRIEGRMVRYL